MAKNKAIWEAGHKRAQPIVMTTVAMVAGMLPIALSLTGDGSWRAPMGVTVIGGLIFSTMLTLLLVPAYFSIAISIESRIGRLFHRVVGSDAHAGGPACPGGVNRVVNPRPARLLSRHEGDDQRRLVPLQPGAARRAGDEGRRDRAARGDGRGVRRQPRVRAALSRGSAMSSRSPKRRWSAASPTGSRSRRCSAIRSACRSRTPRSSRATRTASAKRWRASSRKIS